VAAVVQLPPILSHQTRRSPISAINKTQFQTLRAIKS
jgi:hypothetical protein